MTHHQNGPEPQRPAHRTLLGVDGGGTQTRALVVTPDGRRSEGGAGPANWTTLGAGRCVEAVRAAIQAALRSHDVTVDSLEGACVALAGLYPPWHRSEAEAALGSLLPGVPLRLEPDLIAAWAGATGGEPGVVLIAGTGAVAYGRNASGESARAGGWGPLFGDEGGGFWIGCEALRAIARSLDGRGRPTALGAVLARPLEGASGAASRSAAPSAAEEPSPAELESALRAVYRDAWPRERIASIAECVSRLAAEGDTVCLDLLERAAADLAALVAAVAERLSWSSAALPIIPVGGLFTAGSALRDPLERRIAAALPHAVWRPARGSPVEGALRLAEEMGRWPRS